MEENKITEPVNPTKRPSSTATHSATNKKGGLLFIFVWLFSLLLIGGGGYYLGVKNNSSLQATNIQAPSTSQVSSVTSTPMHVEQTTVTPVRKASYTVAKTMVAYEHPTLHYTLEYPFLWDGETMPNGTGLPGYDDFRVRSRIYEEGKYIDTGAEFDVDVLNTDAKSLDELSARPTKDQTEHPDVLTANIKTTVDGVEAQQEETAIYGSTTTSTKLLKSGKLYIISFRYTDAEMKQAYWNAYQNLLNSFKIK